MSLLFVQIVRASGVADWFTSGSALANLGVGGILGTIVIVLAVLHYRSDRREEARGDAALKGWADATKQFERSLDLIERMQNRKRNGDVG